MAQSHSKLFKNLCKIFVSEISEDDAREAIAEFHALPVVEIESEEIEESKSLMVIEPPKTKEFRVNEKLLYKTFMELGGEIKDANLSRINYAKGETQPSKILLELLEKYAISIDDVVICFGNTGYETNWCILTSRHFMYECNTERGLFTKGYHSRGKILLSDISYLNSLDDVKYGTHDNGSVLLVNHTICKFPHSFSPLYPFLKDYLALEEFENKFENLEEIEIKKNKRK